MPKYPQAVQMTAGLIDGFRLVHPTDRAVGVQHGIAGGDFISAVAVQIDRPRLMRRAMATGIFDGP